jgi:hypothetical protein
VRAQQRRRMWRIRGLQRRVSGDAGGHLGTICVPGPTLKAWTTSPRSLRDDNVENRVSFSRVVGDPHWPKTYLNAAIRPTAMDVLPTPLVVPPTTRQGTPLPIFQGSTQRP